MFIIVHEITDAGAVERRIIKADKIVGINEEAAGVVLLIEWMPGAVQGKRITEDFEFVCAAMGMQLPPEVVVPPVEDDLSHAFDRVVDDYAMKQDES